MRFKKRLQYPGAGRKRVGYHHGCDKPTSARAVLHHTDQKGPKILTGSVTDCSSMSLYVLYLQTKELKIKMPPRRYSNMKVILSMDNYIPG